jgi:probable HAF family extracellular repeat protein
VLGFEAVIWEPKKGEIQALPSFPGDLDTIASAINDKGQAVDGSGTCTTAFHAVLWQNGAVTDLGKPGRCDGNAAFYINNQGEVVGQSDVPGDTTHHASLLNNCAVLMAGGENVNETGLANAELYQ